MLPRKNYFQWFNLLRLGVYLDQILSLKNFKITIFYIKNLKIHVEIHINNSCTNSCIIILGLLFRGIC